jgi:hypothetical protein
VQFHSQNNAEQLQFLANLVMSAQEIEESYENASKGLKSSGYREKLSRDIQDLTKAIVERRKHDELKALAQHGKQCEQDADDQLALQVQLQLREQLKMKRSRTASRPALQDVHTNPLSLVEEEQGV